MVLQGFQGIVKCDNSLIADEKKASLKSLGNFRELAKTFWLDTPLMTKQTETKKMLQLNPSSNGMKEHVPSGCVPRYHGCRPGVPDDNENLQDGEVRNVPLLQFVTKTFLSHGSINQSIKSSESLVAEVESTRHHRHSQ